MGQGDDAVNQGLLWGSLGGAIVILSGSIILTNGSYEYWTYGMGLFFVLILLSALQIFTFIHVWTLNTFLSQQPKQNLGPATVR